MNHKSPRPTTQTLNEPIQPFLKWAGGKRWFVNNHSNNFPIKFKRYIEPFLGSGAVFFHLLPNEAILADSNHELIETYRAVRDDCAGVWEELMKYKREHTKTNYYNVRSSNPRSIVRKAAKLIYLNHTCWNGLYRVNLKGEFNVPVGTKDDVLLERKEFFRLSKSLTGKIIICADFRETIKLADKDDFLFVDPPYTVKHNNNNFIKYNESLFSWADQEALGELLTQAAKKGVSVVATNANHSSVKKLYGNDFILEVLERKSIIAADSCKRGHFEELMIKSKGGRGWGNQ